MTWFESLRMRSRLAAVRDWSFSPRGEPSGRPMRARFVIAARPMPTVDYYLRPGPSALPQRIAFDSELDDLRLRHERLQVDTQVVLVRMPASAWAPWLDERRSEVGEIVWLIDDDVLAARGDRSLPPDYRLKLLSDYVRFKRSFESRVSKIWASTPTIAARYPVGRVEVRAPQALARPTRRGQWVTVFYHGTAAHLVEHQFLRAVFLELQRRSDRTVVEVCGSHALRKHYRGVPRLRVVHPIPWPDYVALLEAGRYDIGLVPLLDSPFNAGRSNIKALELSALGIPGVLSARVAHDEHTGGPKMLYAADDPTDWVERILELVEEYAR